MLDPLTRMGLVRASFAAQSALSATVYAIHPSGVGLRRLFSEFDGRIRQER